MDSATKVLLTFRESAIKDECGNIWTPIGNPTIGAANSKFGSALQLDGQSGIVMQDGIELGGDDFTIDFWMYLEKYEGLQGTLIDSTYRIPADSDSDSVIYRFVRLERAYDKNDLICHISSTCPPTAFNDWADGQLSLSWLFDYGDLGEINWNNEIYEKVMHVALIYSHANHFFGIFINGALEQIAYCNCERQRVNSVYIGCDSDTSNFIVGSISEFRISDGAARWITDENNKLPFSVTWTEDFYVIDGAPEDLDGGSPWFLFDPPTESAHETYQNKERANCDTLRQLTKGHWARGLFDTFRHIISGHERACIDTARRLIERAKVSTGRQINRREKARADTLIQVPVELIFSGSENNSQPICINNFAEYGIIEFNVTLQEHTLSDRFEMKTTGDFEIGQLVRGQLFNYEFSFLVESIHIEHGIKTITGMYNQDRLLYTTIYPQVLINPITGEAYGRGSKIQILNPTAPETESDEQLYAGASYFVTEIAHALNLTPVIAMRDFLPTQDFTDSNITYRDVLSSLFGWTSRVPRALVNVTIRGDYLFCLQRGFESDVFDITNIPHSEPIVDRSLVRSLFNTPLPDSGYAEQDVPFSGTITFMSAGGNHSLRYANGLLVNESDSGLQINGLVGVGNEASASYDYIKLGGEYYLSHKSETSTAENTVDELPTRTITETNTSYEYLHTRDNEIYLHTEHAVINTEEWEGEKQDGLVQAGLWELVDFKRSERRTVHVPLGNGWYGTSVMVDGVPQGSSISQGAPSNKISPYTVKAVWKAFPQADVDPDSDIETVEEWRARLAPINDTTFPVEDEEYLTDLTNEIYWMNRKTEDRVQVTLASKVQNGIPADNYIVDFDKIVQLDGQRYFLVSNQISLTPRKLTQRLSLVRWY